MKCENKEKNLRNCNCSYPCNQKGICCECVRSHRMAGELPACFFPDNAEKTYDRSYAHFVKLYHEGKIN